MFSSELMNFSFFFFGREIKVKKPPESKKHHYFFPDWDLIFEEILIIDFDNLENIKPNKYKCQ